MGWVIIGEWEVRGCVFRGYGWARGKGKGGELALVGSVRPGGGLGVELLAGLVKLGQGGPGGS